MVKQKLSLLSWPWLMGLAIALAVIGFLAANTPMVPEALIIIPIILIVWRVRRKASCSQHRLDMPEHSKRHDDDC